MPAALREQKRRQRPREIEQKQPGVIEVRVPRRWRRIDGPEHRHSHPIDRHLQEGDQQQYMESGQPGEAAKRQPKKRSRLEQLGQDTVQKLVERLRPGDILHVVKRLALVMCSFIGSLAAPAAVASPQSPASPSPQSPASPKGLVILDPGHGGSNPGARGTTGLHEKQLSLVLANRVAERLRARGIAVQLTRTADQTLTLRQRVAIADRAPADLFVSIHANASPTRTQRGYETYVLTARGIDVDGRALRSDTTTPRPGVDPDIALILDDVERGASQW